MLRRDEIARRRAIAARCTLLGALFGVTAAGPVSAQEPPETFRESVVVTGAAGPVELATVTRTVTVITADELARLPVESVSDALRLLSSVDVRARGVLGMQADFSLRGAGFGQVLVLVDGVRINDAQSGHHNGDIPVPLDAIERIEVLQGPGSSLFGADASGGAINVITREGGAPSLVVEGGSFGLAGARGQATLTRGRVRQAVSGEVARSSGFMPARDFESVAFTSRTAVGERTTLLASVLRREFGANGFYGPSPSREWTNQTLVAFGHQLSAGAGWALDFDGSYRTHGDRFVWREDNPAISDNRHRTHEALATLRASRAVGAGRLTAGIESGADWIRSSNLGDHDNHRVSSFAEWRQTVGAADVDASVRVDRYAEFGTSWSPAAGVGWWAGPQMRLRASVGRAFRVPTFTERYYSDPNHLARPEIGPETAWSGEVGADLFPAGGWWVRTTLFGRADRDVIDWQRASTAERWRTFNVHRVRTAGVEVSVRRTFADEAFVQVGYTGQDVNAEAVTLLSKYVLDYAPHVLAVAGTVGLPAGLRLAPVLEYKHRSGASGTSDDVVLDVRVSRAFGAVTLRVDGTNLFDAEYQEIAGVDMPGAAVAVSLAVGGN
jgi:outer membrane cobalamin receptor